MIKSNRIESIDVLRGVVMILMCLDHTRDYFHDLDAAGDPMNLETTTPMLFFTRYITHFCAPIFVFLSGTSAFLQSQRKTKKELSLFLLSRGVWLIFLEIFLNNFLWQFDITYGGIIMQVIWAIGASMVVMAGLIFLHRHLLLIIGLLIVFGHNLLDNITVKGNEISDLLWMLFHQPGGFQLSEERWMYIGYPMLPWLGIMILGYCAGQFYINGFKADVRKKLLLTIGISSLGLFVILRYFNLYGDPRFNYEIQDSVFKNIAAFIQITKYPPSLHYVLVTIGIASILLAIIENSKNKITNFLLVFGRVPLMFYFAHITVIHLLSMFLMPLMDKPWYSAIWSNENQEKGLTGYLGLDLWGVYLFWVLIIALLYFPCRKYMQYKTKNKDKKWLSYL